MREGAYKTGWARRSLAGLASPRGTVRGGSSGAPGKSIASALTYVPYTVQFVAVNVTRLEAIFFRTSNGREPVRDWLLSLSKEERRQIGEDIALRSVQVAHRQAAHRPPSWTRMGDTVKPEQSHCTNVVRSRRRQNGAAAWLHQEVAADAGSGDRTGNQAIQGVASWRNVILIPDRRSTTPEARRRIRGGPRQGPQARPDRAAGGGHAVGQAH